jgi:hypothetical protein
VAATFLKKPQLLALLVGVCMVRGPLLLIFAVLDGFFIYKAWQRNPEFQNYLIVYMMIIGLFFGLIINCLKSLGPL